jgi:CMP-N,N'-diacetyllegionaminic acid synthase
MLRGAPLTAIIPVRGGSQGIPGKNLRRIGRDTLLERAIKLAKAAPNIDRAIVTTDDRAMHDVARSHGVQSPSLRPAELATSTATTAAVVAHVLAECGVSDGYLLILQATAPLRRLADLAEMCEAFEAQSAEAMVSVVAQDEPRPEKLKRIIDGKLVPYLADGFEGPRQALPQPYALNGAFYLVSVAAFLREKRFLPTDTAPFVMPPERSHNLDSMTDWHILEAMIAAGHWQLEEFP